MIEFYISLIFNLLLIAYIAKQQIDNANLKKELHIYQENDRLHDEELSTDEAAPQEQPQA